MKIDWKELLFVGVPSVLAGGGVAWYAKKRGAGLAVSGLAGTGAGAITAFTVRFIKRRIVGAPEQLPDAKLESLPSGEVPVQVPTTDAALGKVAAREKAVDAATPNAKPTNPQEVGTNVVDIRPSSSGDGDDGMNLDAFGSIGSE